MKENNVIKDNLEKLIIKNNNNFTLINLVNNDINKYYFDESTYYYQFIYNTNNLDIIAFLRMNINIKKKILNKVAFIDMIITNDKYSNKNNNFCQKNISLLINNTQKYKDIHKYQLFIDMIDHTLIYCCEKNGFHKKKFIKNSNIYEMEKINYN